MKKSILRGVLLGVGLLVVGWMIEEASHAYTKHCNQQKMMALLQSVVHHPEDYCYSVAVDKQPVDYQSLQVDLDGRQVADWLKTYQPIFEQWSELDSQEQITQPEVEWLQSAVENSKITETDEMTQIEGVLTEGEKDKDEADKVFYRIQLSRK